MSTLVEQLAEWLASAVGEAPAGETCKSCRHIYRVETGSRKVFRKCALVRATHGPGTDIRAKAPACRRWERRASE